ncbi:Electron transfer flavoprotein alpha-subunit [Nowakowskiella sp. JEL0407]|nr:Electron transfer flavoprotein alpha-subunit [Nowakowskiella sp. JEL0407]
MSSNETDQNVETWKIKKLIKSLEAARGNGTSMISLILPPKDQVSRAVKMLADEYGTASNIKSRVNRQSVLDAIVSTQTRLKLYTKVPPNGLVIYCGTIITDEGKEKKVTIDFEPFKPVNTSLYMCDNKFHTGALASLLESDAKFGFIVMDGNGTLFGTLSGNTREILHKFTVDLPKKHGRGGQSALRFSRLRDEKRHNYVRKVAELSVQFFITNDKVNVEGIIMAGSADFKTELSQSDMLDQRLMVKIIKVVDVSYGGENGFNQAIELSGEVLSNVKFIQEKKLIQKYFDEISQDTGRYCFGIDDTLKALDLGAVEKLILWENLDVFRYVLKNPTTGEEKIVHPNKEQEKTKELFVENGVELEVVEKTPLLEWFAEKYKDFGATLEFVTNRSQEGSQFVKGFGGIGGILRYKKFTPSNKKPNPRYNRFAIALKTGKSVALSRTPIQLLSFLQPVKNLIVIADSPNIEIGNFHVHDVVTNLYANLTNGLEPDTPIPYSEVSEKKRPPGTKPTEKDGWKMDAHKNLPGFKLMYETFASNREVQWFVMIDDDTYLIMENLLHVVSHLDPSQPHYLGVPARFLGCDGVKHKGEGPFFAHGGSGILISRAALKLLMTPATPNAERLPIDECILKYKYCWAGDVRTSLCLRDHGVLLAKSFSFNSESPFNNFNWPKQSCIRPVSFHHLKSEEIQLVHHVMEKLADDKANGKTLEGDHSSENDDTLFEADEVVNTHTNKKIGGFTYAEIFQAIYFGENTDQSLKKTLGPDFEKGFDRPGRDVQIQEKQNLRSWGLKTGLLKNEVAERMIEVDIESETTAEKSIKLKSEILAVRELYAKLCHRYCKTAVTWCTGFSFGGKNCYLKAGISKRVKSHGAYSGILPERYLCRKANLSDNKKKYEPAFPDKE